MLYKFNIYKANDKNTFSLYFILSSMTRLHRYEMGWVSAPSRGQLSYCDNINKGENLMSMFYEPNTSERVGKLNNLFSV